MMETNKDFWGKKVHRDCSYRFSYIQQKDEELGRRAEHVFKDFIDRLTKLKPPAQEFYLAVSTDL